MRNAVLLRSVDQLLGENENVLDAAYVWRRHQLSLAYGFACGVGVALLCTALQYSLPTIITLGLVAAALAATASTSYYVVAKTTEGIVLFDASRIRRVAISVRSRLDADDSLEPVDGTVLATDWKIGDQTYTVPKSSEQSMHAIVA